MASIGQHIQKNDNIRQVLKALRQNPQTRMELAKSLQLSWGCISELCTELIENGMITEEKCQSSARGRTPLLLTLCRDKSFVGIDINRMGLHISICDLYGDIKKSAEYPIDTSTESALYRSVTDALSAMIDNSTVAIGAAMQGIRTAKGWSVVCGEDEITVDPAPVIEKAFSLPVMVEHDPNCILFSFTESSEDRLMTVRIDNGIGAAILHGSRFFGEGALELGYMNINGEALGNIMGLDAISRRADMPIEKLAAMDDESSRDHFENAGKVLGIALGNVCNLIKIDRIILCGEMVKYAHLFLKSTKDSYGNTVIPTEAAAITTADIADAAYGAAKLAAMRYPFI